MEGMSEREYSAHSGLSRGAIQKARTRVSQAGRFFVDPPKCHDYLKRYPVDCPAPFPRQGEPVGAF